jgi:MFS family permease
VGTCIAAVVFGLAPTFTVVIITRFVWGILNGTVAVSKVCLAEILDDSNQMRGTSYYGVVGGFGRTVGPLLGGMTPLVHTSFMSQALHRLPHSTCHKVPRHVLCYRSLWEVPVRPAVLCFEWLLPAPNSAGLFPAARDAPSKRFIA